MARESNSKPAGGMHLPQAAIAQAEAAASTSQPDHMSSQADSHPATQLRIPESMQGNAHETPIEQAPPPAYSTEYGQVDFSQDGFDTRAKVSSDGRVNININQKSRGLSDLLVPALRSQLNLQQAEKPPPHPPASIPPFLDHLPGQDAPPPLNVVIHVVGSRGDVQPFIALGKVLKEIYGHRVRLATHLAFRQFVEENGLEYFSIGGDPAELMAFMVKNPGLMPGMDTLRSGDIGKRRRGMYEIIQGCWRSCIEVGDGTGIKASDDHLDSRSSLDSGIGMGGDPSAKPFVADAIIANPPSFAHIHCAEKLGIPLHLMFTMPWSPTQAFPHPLANIQSSNADASITNFISYALVEMMTWQGLGDIINRFREKSLGLEPVSLIWAPGMASRLRIPYTYCWSPALIAKPKDWGPHISISGFYFLSLASNYTPEPNLMAFLEAGPPPVYIGFGSIVVDDPNAMTKLIFEAVKKSGQRALVSKGWGGFGADALGIPEGVFMLGNVPHDWLFKHVSCVVHHGGAGTTAAGIALSKPTVIVPFFGDQPFWGAMVAKAGAGPLPIPSKQLTADKLADGILEALKPTTLRKAQQLGARISSEEGTDVGAKSFHEKLDIGSLRCMIIPNRAAVWRVKRTKIRLSAFAATTLGNEGLLDFNDLKLYRPREYDSEDGPWDPISGGASALLGTIGSLMMGFADFPVEILRALKVKPSDNTIRGETISTATEDTSKSTDSSKLSLESANTGTNNSEGAVEQDVDSASGDARSGQISPIDGEASGATALKTEGNHPNAMASALRTPLSRSSSRSSSPSRLPTQPHRTHSGGQAGEISLDAALGAGKGIGRMVGAGLKSPMDFTFGIARGFHNAPKLYGDESVRQAEKITDIQSGLKAAGKEFGFGFYDGISGLVTQPLEGAKKEGMAGFVKGFGKGIGGVVLKPGAAIWGLPGYAFKGIYKELQKHLGSSVQNYIIAARTAQGYEDWNNSDREERLAVVSRWQAMKIELVKEKEQTSRGTYHGSHGLLKTKHLSFDERKRLAQEKKKSRKGNKGKAAQQDASEPSTSGADPVTSNSDTADFEEAIQASVAATSHGDPDEDRMIERAIRASVVELQLASGEGREADAVQRAIKASVAEAARARSSNTPRNTADHIDKAIGHDKGLEEALQHSMQGHHDEQQNHPMTNVDCDDSGVETDDDENIKAAIHQSKSFSAAAPAVSEDSDLNQAIELSNKAREDQDEKISKARTEEEIILEYVKKQSLAEDLHKKNTAQAPSSSTSHDPNDAELQRAMGESLRMHGKDGESSSA